MSQPTQAQIVIIEDDLLVLKATRLVLEQAGYTVSTATSGAEGLRQVEKLRPDLVLLDRILPDGDGAALCQRIKTQPATAGCFVVLTSSHKTSADEQVDGLYAGADGYIARPISNRELLARVAAMLRIKQAEDIAWQDRSRLASIVEHSADAIISVGPDGQILTWNRAAEQLFGVAAAVAMGQTVPALIPFEAPEKLVTALEKIWRGESSVHLPELPVLTDNGPISVSFTVSPVKGSGEQLVGASLIGRNVTELKQTYDAREREMKNLEALSGAGKAPVTAASFGVHPLRQAQPQLFALLTASYEQALQQAIETKMYRVDHPISDRLRSIAEALGQARAGPRDVTQIHLTALKNLGRGQPAAKIQAFAEEGRLLLVELMGYIISYYRNYFLRTE